MCLYRNRETGGESKINDSVGSLGCWLGWNIRCKGMITSPEHQGVGFGLVLFEIYIEISKKCTFISYER
jgi:hypothetical protein